MPKIKLASIAAKIVTIYERKVPKVVRDATKARINRDALSLITAISDDMKDSIGELLRQGEEEGKSVSATASSLLKTGLDKGIFKSARRRAYLIARTELHRARQLAAVDIYKAAKIDIVKWVGIPSDGRICNECLAMHGRHFNINEIEDKLPPKHPRCYSDDTEVYTKRGWLFFKDLEQDDLILSLNPESKNLEWSNILCRIKYFYKGVMKHLTNKGLSFDMLVTPDHPFFVYREIDHGKYSNWNPVFVEINKLRKWTDKFYLTSKWIGENEKEVNINGLTIPIETFSEFLGYYLSEGSVSKCTLPSKFEFQITIEQWKKENKERMYACCSKLGAEKVWNGKTTIYVMDDRLAKYLLRFGKSHERFIPDIIKESTKEIISIFLDAYIVGDGSIQKSYFETYPVTCKSITTSSNKMSSDLGELIVKIGKSVGYRFDARKGDECKFSNGKYKINHDVWLINILNSQNHWMCSTKIEDIEYNGFVYDANLEKNHTLFTRRNGRTTWSSNCRCRVIPADFQLEISVKKDKEGKVVSTKILPTPKDYLYVVKLKKSGDIEKAKRVFVPAGVRHKAYYRTDPRLAKYEISEGGSSPIMEASQREVLSDLQTILEKFGKVQIKGDNRINLVDSKYFDMVGLHVESINEKWAPKGKIVLDQFYTKSEYRGGGPEGVATKLYMELGKVAEKYGDGKLHLYSPGEFTKQKRFWERLPNMAIEKSDQAINNEWSGITAKLGEELDLEKGYDYKSTQVNLPKGLADKVLNLTKLIDPEDLHPTEKQDDVPHITIRYGFLKDTVPEQVKEILSKIGSITASILFVDVFQPEEKDYDVLILRIDSPGLALLNEKLKILPHKDTQPFYQPHITICYLKRGKGNKYKNLATGLEGEPLEFEIVKFSDLDGNKTDINLEKGRHKYIRREGSPGKYSYVYEEPFKSKSEKVAVPTKDVSQNREEEQELARRFLENRDIGARDELIERNQKFVYKVAHDLIKQYHNHPQIEFQDLAQEGVLGLVHAINKFELGRERLITYAYPWIWAYMKKHIEKRLYESKKEISEWVTDDEEGEETSIANITPSSFASPEDVTISEQQKQILQIAIKKLLNLKETEVIYNRYLSDKPMTLEKVGEKLNLTKERIRQIENGALKKLRKLRLAYPSLEKARSYARWKYGKYEHVKGYPGKPRLFDLSPTDRIKRYLLDFSKPEIETALKIISDIKEAGGKVLFVGGSVRDALIGKRSKDIDLEAYGLEPETLGTLLEKHGKVDKVGKSFGVFKVTAQGAESLDVSIPRRESKTGKGHKGFMTEHDPSMSYKEASGRRDLTINALAYDPVEDKIIDEHGGLQDIKDKKLRATNTETFKEDSLRVLRVMRFSAQLGFLPDFQLIRICREMDLSDLPKERIFGELEGMLLKSKEPSIGLRLVPILGIDKILPELTNLRGVEQETDWHPEGDAWKHTLMVVDAAAKMRKNLTNKSDKLAFMLAVLCHDMGKPMTTEVREGKITSYGHDEEGAKVAVEFLNRFTNEKDLIEKVEELVRHHMKPTMFFHDKVPDSAIRRLSKKVDIPMLLMVSVADKMGRGLEKTNLEAERWLMQRYKKLGLEHPKALDPKVMGRHLLPLGFPPSKELGIVLDKIYNAQLEGKFQTTEEGIEYAKQQGWINKDLAKSRSHKYIRREGTPGKYEYFYVKPPYQAESTVDDIKLKEDASKIAIKYGVSEKFLKFVGKQDLRPLENSYLNLWNILDPKSKHYKSTVTSGIVYPLEIEPSKQRELGKVTRPDEEVFRENQFLATVQSLKKSYNFRGITFGASKDKFIEVNRLKNSLEELSKKMVVDGKGILQVEVIGLPDVEEGQANAFYFRELRMIQLKKSHENSFPHEYGHFVFFESLLHQPWEQIEFIDPVGLELPPLLRIDPFKRYLADLSDEASLARSELLANAVKVGYSNYFESLKTVMNPDSKEYEALKDLFTQMSNYYGGNRIKDNASKNFVDNYSYILEPSEVFARAVHSYVYGIPDRVTQMEYTKEYQTIVNNWGERWLKTGVIKSEAIFEMFENLKKSAGTRLVMVPGKVRISNVRRMRDRYIPYRIGKDIEWAKSTKEGLILERPAVKGDDILVKNITAKVTAVGKIGCSARDESGNKYQVLHEDVKIVLRKNA